MTDCTHQETPYMSGDEHPRYPREDWRYEVLSDYTQLSYPEWVEHQIEANAIDSDGDTPREFVVTWAINVTAADPLAAAGQAFEMMRDSDSLATVFDVTDESGQRARVDVEYTHRGYVPTPFIEG